MYKLSLTLSFLFLRRLLIPFFFFLSLRCTQVYYYTVFSIAAHWNNYLAKTSDDKSFNPHEQVTYVRTKTKSFNEDQNDVKYNKQRRWAFNFLDNQTKNTKNSTKSKITSWRCNYRTRHPNIWKARKQRQKWNAPIPKRGSRLYPEPQAILQFHQLSFFRVPKHLNHIYLVQSQTHQKSTAIEP